MSIASEVGALRKAGNIDDAVRIAREGLIATPDDFYLQNAYGWVIYEQLKRVTSEHEQGTLPSSELVRIFDSILNEYARLNQVKRPDLLHSLILTMVIKGAREWPRFLDFAKWWDPRSFRDEDRQPYVLGNGKEIPSLMLRFSYAIGRALAKEGDQKPSEATDWALEQLDEALDNYPDDHWLHYYKSKQLLMQHLSVDAREHLLPVVKRQKSAAWAWSLLGRAWEDESPDKAITCYLYAISLADRPVSVLKTRVRVATLLAKEERFSEAAHQVRKALDVREKFGYKVPADLAQLRQAQWYIQQENLKELPNGPKVHDAAMDILFDHVVYRLGVLDNQNTEKSLAHVSFNVDEGVILSYSRYGDIKQVSTGTLVEVGFEDESWKRPIRWRMSESKCVMGFYEEFEGMLDRPPDKTFGFIRVDGRSDIYVPPFVMSGVEDLVDLPVMCKAVLSEDKKKGVEGWKALMVWK